MPYLLAALHDKNKAKVVFHSHNSVCRLKSQKLLRWLYSKRIDGRFACSEGAGKMMFGKNFGNSQHDLVIRNAIDIEKCRFNESGRNNLRNQLNADNKIIVGTVGRNSYSKNQQFLIQLASIVNDDYVFIIIGEGELRKQLEKQILDLNLSSKVILIGNNNEIGSWMSAFDIFLLPSLYEGLPYVAIEAQCSGLLCGFSDAITRECKLTDLSYFLKTNSIEKWKDFLLSFDPTNNYDRSKYSTILSETNFNAKNEVKIILEEMLKI